MNILLLDAHTVQSISVARSLKENGHVIFCFIESRLSYGYVSRFVDHKILCPILRDAPSEYLNFLVDFLGKNPQDVIIPMYNDSAELLSQNKERIENSFSVKCAIPHYDTFIKAHDKERLMDVCKQRSFPLPRTALLSSKNLHEVVSYVGFPALIKPNISSGARGIMLVHEEKELLDKWPAIERDFGRCTLQEYVDHTGIYYNVMLYLEKSRVCH